MRRQTGETAGHSIGPPRSHDSHLSMLVTFSNRYAFRQKKLLHQLFFFFIKDILGKMELVNETSKKFPIYSLN